MDKNVITEILESIRSEMSALVEKAVVSALSKMREERNYPELVGVDLASEITGYSKNSLYQMHSHGQIPCAVKVGARLLFRTKELKEWVNDGGPSGVKALDRRK